MAWSQLREGWLCIYQAWVPGDTPESCRGQHGAENSPTRLPVSEAGLSTCPARLAGAGLGARRAASQAHS